MNTKRTKLKNGCITIDSTLEKDTALHNVYFKQLRPGVVQFFLAKKPLLTLNLENSELLNIQKLSIAFEETPKLTSLKKRRIITLVSKVTHQYKKYFIKQPKIFINDECLKLNFETKNNYSRSVNLYVFEHLMNELRTDIMSFLEQNEIYDLSFWSCDSCNMCFTICHI